MALSQVAFSGSVDAQPSGLKVTMEPSVCLHVNKKSSVPIPWRVRLIHSHCWHPGALEDQHPDAKGPGILWLQTLALTKMLALGECNLQYPFQSVVRAF